MTADANPLQIVTVDTADCPRQADFLIDDGCWLGDGTAIRGVILPDQNESRARGLLEMEVPTVFLGEAALQDSELVERLARQYGPERIGVYLPVRRLEVSWRLETESNADFKTFSPSHCEPAWEILLADGSRTGTLAAWWLQAMFERGAGSAMIRTDIEDDTDLNICAGLTELHADRLWFAPMTAGANHYADWLRWGKVARLAVPVTDFDGHPDIQALTAHPVEEIAA
jgi:hypothetical protein